MKENEINNSVFSVSFLFLSQFQASVNIFKSLLYCRHLVTSPSFGRADSSGVAFRRRQLSALQTMELPLDGDKYDSLLIFTVTVKTLVSRFVSN